MREIILQLLDSFEKRVQLVNNITRDYQHLIDRTRQRRLFLLNELCEKLAHKGSVRRKDFDTIMDPLCSYYGKKEGVLTTCLNHYVRENRNMTDYLKSLLAHPLNLTADGDSKQVIASQTDLGEIKRELEEREFRAAQALEQYHDDHAQYERTVVNLLSDDKGNGTKLKMAVSGLLSKVRGNDTQPSTTKKEKEEISWKS